MPDWEKSMQRTYEYYTVDPNTWSDDKRITTVKSSSINNDEEVESLGSASFDVVDALGECYIRTYLVTIQNGITERHPLGVHLIQTPSSKFDGKSRSVSMDAYTPLIELKEKPIPIGYTVHKDEEIMSYAYRLTKENLRAPVVKPDCSETLADNFVANTNDTWLSFNSDLMSNAKYRYGLDEMGRVIFLPIQKTASLQPVYTFNDDNSSLLLPEITVDHDLFGIPNVVEVIYSNPKTDHAKNNHLYYARVVNDDPNSPISTVARGREIVHRVTDSNLFVNPTGNQVQEYAEQLLEELSTLEYTVSFTHGYRPIRIGDCVRLNYTRAGIIDVKAKVISQSIKCDLNCQVSTKARYTKKLWR